MRIIDSHTHIFPAEVAADRAGFASRDPWFAELYGDPRARLATAEDLIAAMDAAGVEHAITFGFGWRDPGIIRLANDAVIAAVRAYPTRLTGFAVVQPAGDGVAAAHEIARCADAGLRGVGELMPHGQGYRLGDVSLLAPLAEACAARDLPVLTHSSEPVGHRYPGKGDVSVADLVAFLTAFPALRVIAAHWGGGLPFYCHMPEVAAVAARCWYDTAASPYLYAPSIFAGVAAAVGWEKILWATDFAVIRYPRMLRYTHAANLDEATMALVMGGNAAGLLGLDDA